MPVCWPTLFRKPVECALKPTEFRFRESRHSGSRAIKKFDCADAMHRLKRRDVSRLFQELRANERFCGRPRSIHTAIQDAGAAAASGRRRSIGTNAMGATPWSACFIDRRISSPIGCAAGRQKCSAATACTLRYFVPGANGRPFEGCLPAASCAGEVSQRATAALVKYARSLGTAKSKNARTLGTDRRP